MSTPDSLHAFREVPRTGVIFVMAEATRRGFHYGHPDWANLGQGAPETGPLPGGHERIEHFDITDRHHEYSPVGGRLDLREAVAALYNERYRKGMPSQYTAENVAISGGGRVGLTRVAASLGSIHLGHLLPDYTAYEELMSTFASFVPIPIVLDRAEGFTLPVSRLREEIVGKGLGALLLSNPANPTATALRGGALRSWVEVGRELSCTLIVDEFYSHYLYGDAARSDAPSLSAAAYVEDVNEDPVVIIDGLSKNWRYPGWRLSWTVGPKAVIDRVTSAGSFLDGGASHPVQKAALSLIDRTIADQEAAAIQQVFGAKRDFVVERLRGMGMGLPSVPMGSFYAFACLDDLPASLRDGMDFFRAALQRNVIVVPGEFFDVNPGQRRGHIPSRLKRFVRISFGPAMDTLQVGLDRIDAMIREA